MKSPKHFWGTQAVVLGVWEAIAIKTGKLPTITRTVKAAKTRRSRLTHAAVVVWLIGLGRHLLKD